MGSCMSSSNSVPTGMSAMTAANLQVDFGPTKPERGVQLGEGQVRGWDRKFSIVGLN